MRATLALLIFLIYPTILIAQWGELTKEEINLKEVSFEIGAGAVILKEEADLFITKKGYILEQHSKIKILSTSGYDAAQKKWSYYTANNYDEVIFEDGHTINIVDGKQVITPVNKSDIYITDVDDETREVSVAFPHVSVGSVIEYKIRIQRAYNGYTTVWRFQNQLPTLSSILNKKNTSYGEIILYGEFLNKKYKKKTHRQKWELNNVPSTKNYSLVYNPNDYIDRIALQDAYSDGDSWKRFVKIIHSEIEKSTKKINFNEIADKIPNGSTKLETLQNCVQYIQDNLKWDEHYEVIPNNLNENLLRYKSGNTADLNVLLQKILTAKKIDTELVINSNRSNGRIVMVYPVLSGIQTLLNLVTIENGERLIIDAANSVPNEIKYLPLDFFNIIVAKINAPHKFITNFPFLSEHISQQVLEITPMRTELKIKDYYKGYYKEKTIDDIIHTSVSGNLRYESKEELSEDWKVKSRIYELENINFLTFENQFNDIIKDISIEEDRKYPIEIDFPFQNIVQIVAKNRPEEYEFDILNFDIEVTAFDGQLKYLQKAEYSESNIILTWQLLVAKSFFNTNEINEYHNFIKKVQDAAKHSAILKRISTKFTIQKN